MNTLTVFSFVSSLLGFLGGSYFQEIVLFESDESRTQKGNPVFNKIKFSQQGGKDIWEMKQSHKGLHAKKQDWDQIKIVVNTNIKPMSASFHQIKDDKEVEYAANCMRCHSSGPRLIRPSPKSSLSLKEKVTLTYWNSKIKSYGHVKFQENKLEKVRKIKMELPPGNQKVTLKKCIGCHKEGGIRGQLNTFQKGSILHLINTQQMPPWPLKLTPIEKNKLMDEIYLNTNSH